MKILLMASVMWLTLFNTHCLILHLIPVARRAQAVPLHLDSTIDFSPRKPGSHPFPTRPIHLSAYSPRLVEALTVYSIQQLYNLYF